MRRKTTVRMLPALLIAVVALVVAGCGGGGDNVKASPSAASANMSAPSGGGATVALGSGPLGRHLVDSKGRTLYLFEKDTGTMSTCSGACASLWPASTTSGDPKVGSGVDAKLLGSTKRSDRGTQLTYNGHPLYRFSGDHAAGDTNGQGLTDFGAGWYVVSAAGQKIEGGKAASTPKGGGNGYY
jgi:predicted lipoprotein with Yx(FWY)xxD motif